MSRPSVILAALFAFVASALLALSCQADAALLLSHSTRTTQDAGPFRVMLAVLPAEPFLTKAQAKRGGSGMLAVAGASAVDPSAPSHPNHHLVIHVYDRTDGRVLRGGHITMRLTRMNHAATSGAPFIVPVVEMQVAGKGPQSTHYGNNVSMRAGAYRVEVSINESTRTVFVVQVM